MMDMNRSDVVPLTLAAALFFALRMPTMLGGILAITCVLLLLLYTKTR